jgi:hypothetical protein
MLINPELQALRGNDAPQRSAQSAIGAILDDWRRNRGGLIVEAELEKFRAGGALEDLPMLSSLFADDADSAQQFVERLLGPFLAQLARQPLSQSPLRFSCDDLQSTLMIARKGTTSLTLQAIDCAALARKPAPVSVSFAATETYERVMAGEAHVTRVRLLSHRSEGVELASSDAVLQTGDLQHRLGHREVQLLRGGTGSLVTLRLQRRTGSGGVSSEFRLEDGMLVHQAAGHPRDSRLELTAALLGKMGRTDAAPLLAAMAEEEGSQSLRWHSLRECLGLDTALGFRTLCAIAQRSGDPLAILAGALRGQLIEAHPQLAGLCACPA